MGGLGSGRRAGRPVVEDVLCLEVNLLRREGLLRAGPQRSGVISWHRAFTGEVSNSVAFRIQTADARGTLALLFEMTSADGSTASIHCCVDLRATLQQFGGQRWWFICPLSGRRVIKLYLPSGSRTFASRHAHRLGYLSQREMPQDRALSKTYKARERLGSVGGVGDYIERPKRMHRRTFERELAKINEAEAALELQTKLFVERVGRKTLRSGLV